MYVYACVYIYNHLILYYRIHVFVFNRLLTAPKVGQSWPMTRLEGSLFFPMPRPPRRTSPHPPCSSDPSWTYTWAETAEKLGFHWRDLGLKHQTSLESDMKSYIR